jgi:predicted dehydrogenase
MANTAENSFLLERSGEEPLKLNPDQILTEHLERLGVRARPNFWNELASRAFFEAIRAGRPASPGFADALVAHATIEAAYRSAKERRAVELKELI